MNKNQGDRDTIVIMEKAPYLVQLSLRLLEGLDRVPAEVRQRHASYLQASQNPDGGFSGREGGSDLYYTGFALRGLAVLDELTPEISERMAEFLRQRLSGQAGIIDFFSLLYSCFLLQLTGVDVLADRQADWPQRVASTLERFRTPDCGYAKAIGNPAGSVYHTFLAVLCYQLLEMPLPRRDELLQFILSRRRDDGGYVEIAPMRKSGTNPTAAAVGLLQILEDSETIGAAFSVEARSAAIDFLAGMVSAEGGLRGHGRIPVADLLSTFTGLWSLHQLNALDRIDSRAALRFVGALELPAGGFRSGMWDLATDVEYTFYGLGCYGLLWPISS